MKLEKLVNEYGPLAKAYSKLNPETIQHSYEIMNQRRTDESLRNIWFWTADFPMYAIKGKDAILYLAPRENNLIFQNIEEATNQLIKTGNYNPKHGDAQKVMKADTTLKINLSDLELKGDDDEWRYFEIDTKRYDKTLNPPQTRLAKAVYGHRADFAKNMDMLNKNSIGKTRIWVFSPDYVKAIAKNGPIGRASRLSGIGDDSRFLAYGWLVNCSYGALRGVRKVVAEGDARKTFGQKKIDNYLKILEGVKTGTLPASNLEKVINGLSSLKQKG